MLSHYLLNIVLGNAVLFGKSNIGFFQNLLPDALFHQLFQTSIGCVIEDFIAYVSFLFFHDRSSRKYSGPFLNRR